MTADMFNELVNKHGEKNVIALVYDNSVIDYYVDKDHEFSLKNDTEMLGGDLVIYSRPVFPNKETGKIDIEIKCAHPVDCLQYIYFANSMKEKETINISSLVAY